MDSTWTKPLTAKFSACGNDTVFFEYYYSMRILQRRIPESKSIVFEYRGQKHRGGEIGWLNIKSTNRQKGVILKLFLPLPRGPPITAV